MTRLPTADRDPDDLGSTQPRSRRRWWTRMMLALVLLGVLLAAVPAAMVAFPRDDDPASTEGIVVLGGVGQERADLGIELSQSYDVPLVLSSSATWFANERGYRCSLGNALCLERPFATNTAGEARSTRSFVEERGWTHVTVVTSSHHTARARILFRQCLGDGVSVVGAPRDTGVKVGEYASEVVGILAAVTFQRAC